MDGLGNEEEIRRFDWMTRGVKRGMGPLCFSAADAFVEDPHASAVWRVGESQLTVYLAPSVWFGRWINRGLPFHDLTQNHPMIVWGAGVDVDRFVPLVQPKTKRHTFFIYFKSQNWSALSTVHEYLFRNYFRMHGPTLTYYFHTHAELLDAAQNAEFCIFLAGEETQGLASLEIMATGCPLFVLDSTEFTYNGLVTQQVTSVTCWDSGCGMKSKLDRIAEDFPIFLDSLTTYRPREFVLENYSWSVTAKKLQRILSAL
jgi:hypothetical protein